MAAAALTFRESLEVSLVVIVGYSFAGAGVFGTSLGVNAKAILRASMVGLGAAAIVLIERLERRTWGALIGVMLFVFFGYLVAFEAGALPQNGLIPSPPAGPDRGVNPIATVLGITTIVLIARFAIRRGQFQPRASRIVPAATVVWWSR
jgi:hypothetical protein